MADCLIRRLRISLWTGPSTTKASGPLVRIFPLFFTSSALALTSLVPLYPTARLGTPRGPARSAQPSFSSASHDSPFDSPCVSSVSTAAQRARAQSAAPRAPAVFAEWLLDFFRNDTLGLRPVEPYLLPALPGSAPPHRNPAATAAAAADGAAAASGSSPRGAAAPAAAGASSEIAPPAAAENVAQQRSTPAETSALPQLDVPVVGDGARAAPHDRRRYAASNDRRASGQPGAASSARQQRRGDSLFRDHSPDREGALGGDAAAAAASSPGDSDEGPRLFVDAGEEYEDWDASESSDEEEEATAAGGSGTGGVESPFRGAGFPPQRKAGTSSAEPFVPAPAAANAFFGGGLGDESDANAVPRSAQALPRVSPEVAAKLACQPHAMRATGTRNLNERYTAVLDKLVLAYKQEGDMGRALAFRRASSVVGLHGARESTRVVAPLPFPAPPAFSPLTRPLPAKASLSKTPYVCVSAARPAQTSASPVWRTSTSCAASTTSARAPSTCLRTSSSTAPRSGSSACPAGSACGARSCS